MKKPRKQRSKGKPHRASALVASQVHAKSGGSAQTKARGNAHAKTASPLRFRNKGSAWARSTAWARAWTRSAAAQGRASADNLRKIARTAGSLRLDDLSRTADRCWTSAKSSAARRADTLQTHIVRLSEAAAPRQRLDRVRTDARAFAQAYGHNDRQAFALLVLPFLIVASAVVVHQSMRSLHAYMTLAGIRTPDAVLASVRPPATPLRTAIDTVPRTSARETVAQRIALAPVNGGAAPLAPAHAAPQRLAEPHTALSGAPEAPLGAAVPPRLAERSIPAIPEPGTTSKPQPAVLALLAPFAAIDRNAPPSPVDTMTAMDTDEHGVPVRPGICTTDDVARTVPASFSTSDPANLSDEAFGVELAKAAQSQVGKFVIYNDAYRSISYPMGDVNGLFGVCTDVIVRAYRSLGVDLQPLVHRARSGSGDTNIDHRRTEVLRRFFATQGESLPPSTFPEDYRPGDIVTYYRPQNRGSRSHIAMVSSVIAPSGRPMIIHNRGWGPQLEDALFVDEMTGHYRYRGARLTRDAALPATLPAATPDRPAAGKAQPASAALRVRFPLP